MPTIDASATTSGSREAVWAQLADITKWTQWGTWSTVEVEGGGEHGPGAIRHLVKKPYDLRERVTDWEPGERMGYELVDGMKVEGYKARVSLEDAPDGGTIVRWHSSYDKARPLTAIVLRLAVRDSCKRVAKAAAA
jgi:uncharacterized membrane protein